MIRRVGESYQESIHKLCFTDVGLGHDGAVEFLGDDTYWMVW